jgi:hypothetical protein
MKAIAHLAVLFAIALMMASSPARSDAGRAGYDEGRLYNLGNAYAHAGQPGLAVLNYERARLLAPDDADLEANLRRVREAAHVPAEPSSTLDMFRLPRPYIVAVLVIAGLLLTGLSGIAWRRGLRSPRLLMLASGIGLLCVGWAGCNVALVWPKLHSAVVIGPQAPVRAAPAPLGDALFELREAETVNITAEHEDFVLIIASQGRTGWMSRAAVAEIIPRK